MRLFKKKPPAVQLTRTEALRCIPQKAATATCQILEDGDILIEYPLNIRPFFLQIARRFNPQVALPEPTKKLQLDRLGGMVWQMVDGEKNVGTIIKEFARASGFTLQEAELSVTAFFRQLGRRGLILMRGARE
jgi:hypothetical protein